MFEQINHNVLKALLGTLSAVALGLSLSTNAYAGVQEGTINVLYVRASDGLVWVELTGAATDKPACAKGHSYWMVKDENSAAGKKQLAMLLLAQATGKKIVISGSGACTRWSDGEDIETVGLNQ